MWDFLGFCLGVFLKSITLLIVKLWKKKYFKKELYCDEKVGIILLFSDALILLTPFLVFLGIFDGFTGPVLVIIVLITNAFLLPMYVYNSTTCIYLEEDYLCKRNLVIFKKIQINKNTIIRRSWFKCVISTDKKKIIIPDPRNLEGPYIMFLYRINEIINYKKEIS